MTEGPAAVPLERIQVRVRILADDGVTYEEHWWPFRRLLDIVDDEFAKAVDVVIKEMENKEPDSTS